LRAAQHRVAVRPRKELLRDFGELLRPAVAAVLEVELESAGGAEPEDRRRIERPTSTSPPPGHYASSAVSEPSLSTPPAGASS
jgi:hypothetical protein